MQPDCQCLDSACCFLPSMSTCARCVPDVALLSAEQCSFDSVPAVQAHLIQCLQCLLWLHCYLSLCCRRLIGARCKANRSRTCIFTDQMCCNYCKAAFLVCGPVRRRRSKHTLVSREDAVSNTQTLCLCASPTQTSNPWTSLPCSFNQTATRVPKIRIKSLKIVLWSELCIKIYSQNNDSCLEHLVQSLPPAAGAAAAELHPGYSM